MEEGVEWSPPETTSAAEDCNEAVPEWMGKAEAGVKAGKGAIAGKPQAGCPSYCGERPDYETGKRVRGQSSEGTGRPPRSSRWISAARRRRR